jgi:hypothetical protein
VKMEESKGFLREASFFRWFGIIATLLVLVVFALLVSSAIATGRSMSGAQGYGTLQLAMLSPVGLVLIAMVVISILLIKVGKVGTGFLKLKIAAVVLLLLPIGPMVWAFLTPVGHAWGSGAKLFLVSIPALALLAAAFIILVVVAVKQRRSLAIK